MANIFISLAVPAGVGVGASSNMSAQGQEKTITVTGTIEGIVTVEFSNDGGPASDTWQPVASFQNEGSKIISIAAQFMRVRSSIAVFTGTVDVGSTDDGAQFADLPVTAGDGTGARVDASSEG